VCKIQVYRRHWNEREFYLGTWNVLSLYRTGALKLLEQLGNYKASIIALQAAQSTEEGILEWNDYTIFYSCDKKTHQMGTSFIVKKDFKQLVIDFKPVNSRICSLQIKGTFLNYTLICAHAPIEASTEEEKEEFYEMLEDVYEKSPKNDVKIILGDMNA
jgi:exonuclease III